MNFEENEPLREHPALFSEIRWTPFSLGRACSFFMIPFVVGIVGLTWVPYVRIFGDGTSLGIACLVVFHVLLFLLVLSYFQAVVCSGGCAES
jgi:hypothetical protein